MELWMLIALFAMRPAVVQQPHQIVLFVCEHGAAKSVVAAAEFNRMAAERGLPFRAISRGTAPDAAVPSRVTDGLERHGLQVPAGFTPTALSGPDLTSAAHIVTFDARLPTTSGSAQSVPWDGLPAFSDDYDAAHRAVRSKIESLIRELHEAGKVKPARQ
jgi:arsenate reductase